MEQEKQQGKQLQFILQGHGFNVRAERSSVYSVRVRLAVAVGTKAEAATVTLFLAGLEWYTYQMSKL